MSLSLVTGPNAEPVTIDTVKAHLRLEIPDDDALVAGYLLAARNWVEGQTHRALPVQTWDYTIDYGWPFRFGRHRIDLPLNPVKSVTSITYVSDSGAEQTTTAYQAVCRTNGSYIVPTYGNTFPTVRRQPEAITVRFVAGYDEVPWELKQAIMLLVGHMYEHREPIVTGTIVAELPFAVEALISPYRCATV